jgi:hypothetical protein
MLTKQWFHYEAGEGVEYDLGLEYTVHNGRPAVIGADLYRADGSYVGYWSRSEMPVHLIYDAEKWIRGDPSFATFAISRGRRALPR